MAVSCPECHTSYTISQSAHRRRLRCVRCGHDWRPDLRPEPLPEPLPPLSRPIASRPAATEVRLVADRAGSATSADGAEEAGRSIGWVIVLLALMLLVAAGYVFRAQVSPTQWLPTGLTKG